MTLTFKSGFNGGYNQTFRVEVKKPGGVWTAVGDVISDPGYNKDVRTVISGLESDVTYEVRIKAENGEGAVFAAAVSEKTKGNVLSKLPWVC